ncbi:MAG: hypothetical protein QXR69_01100 [Conexivisphaerales archaeon]
MHRNLGSITPKGSDVYELFLIVKSGPSILGKISNVLGSKNIDILQVHGQVSEDKSIGHIIFYLEMAKSLASVNQLVEEMKAMDFVVEAYIEPKHEMLYESFMFPLYGYTSRVVLGNAESYATAINSLLETFGSAGEVILQNAGEAYGRQIIDLIRNALSEQFRNDMNVLLNNMKGYLRATGVAIADINVRDNSFIVKLSDTILGNKYSKVDYILIGIIRGAIESIIGKRLEVKDTRYDMDDKTIKFKLETFD